MLKKINSVFTISTIGVCLLACAFGPVDLQAQSGSASVAGTVLDPDGKPVPNVDVTVKNEVSGATNKATSGSDGHYSVSVTTAGSYTLEATAPGFGEFHVTGVQVTGGAVEVPVKLVVASMSQAITVEGFVPMAVETAPEGNTLEADSARTEISGTFIKNFETPIADYGEVVNYAPGTFTLSPNGAGLGQGKIFFRGLGDGEYNVTFDDIPFTDTNSVSHHTWANFPAPWIGSTEMDRSPGQALNFGPSTFGGAINLKSVDLQASPDIRGTISYGSWNTRLLKLDIDSGLFGPGNRNDFSIDIHQLDSNGYQTFNYQKRDGGSAKFQHRVSARTTVTLFSGVLDLWNNTPNTTTATRAQIAEYGDNYLLDSTPYLSNGTPDPYYYGYNYYHVQTDFEYIGFDTDLGNGWRFDTKAFTYRYWNKQNYQNGATVSLSSSKPSGVDKLNGYRQAGDIATLSHDDKWGTFSVGGWYNWAYTDRYQIPENILTGQDTPLGNFHEHFITQTFQPFVQYAWRATAKLVITAGVKDNNYAMALQQYQDNGKTVGCLGGVASKDFVTGAPNCIGGAAFVYHSIDYNNLLPTLTARYHVSRNVSVYAQAAEGSTEPPSSVFDVPGGNVTTPPKATIAKTYQTGTVIKHNRWTLDGDAYYLHYQNGYDSYTDPATGEPVNILTGPSNAKGLEAESNIVIGHGLSLYLNGSMGSDKYQGGPNYPNGGEWVANAPKNVETAGLLYQQKNWDLGLIEKRVGTMYNDNGSLTYLINGISIPYPVDQAVTINPFDITNFNANYTIKNESWLRGSKIGFSVNNLFDSHNLVGITPAIAATATTPFVASPSDQLNLLPGRSIMVSLTVGYAPKR